MGLSAPSHGRAAIHGYPPGSSVAIWAQLQLVLAQRYACSLDVRVSRRPRFAWRMTRSGRDRAFSDHPVVHGRHEAGGQRRNAEIGDLLHSILSTHPDHLDFGMDGGGWASAREISRCRPFRKTRPTLGELHLAARKDPARFELRDRLIRLKPKQQEGYTLSFEEAEDIGTAYHASPATAHRGILGRGISPRGPGSKQRGGGVVRMVSAFPDSIEARRRLPGSAQVL